MDASAIGEQHFIHARPAQKRDDAVSVRFDHAANMHKQIDSASTIDY